GKGQRDHRRSARRIGQPTEGCTSRTLGSESLSSGVWYYAFSRRLSQQPTNCRLLHANSRAFLGFFGRRSFASEGDKGSATSLACRKGIGPITIRLAQAQY